MIKLKELLNEVNVIQKIDKLAKANKYGTVDGTRMNGKTAREIMAIFRHPKMNSYRNQMLGMKSHELADLTVTLVKPLKIKVESVNEDLTPLRKIYADLDKKFPKYNHKKISDVNKVVKFLKRKLKPGSQLPDFVASFYNDYRGGEDITKNHKRFFQYTGRMLKKKESVKEGSIDDSDNEIQSQIEEKAKRDYKAEYKKFQSSTKAKKYRAELNKYNRKKGTYGNGDGKDASHKGGKIVGFEKESANRGRREKSRLKK